MSEDTQQDPHSVRPEGFEIKSTPGYVPSLVPAAEGVHAGVMHAGASNRPGSDDRPRSAVPDTGDGEQDVDAPESDPEPESEPTESSEDAPEPAKKSTATRKTTATKAGPK